LEVESCIEFDIALLGFSKDHNWMQKRICAEAIIARSVFKATIVLNAVSLE